ncbi:MAG: DUF2019 domain-containing protein [Xanthobacteraceae bacterium]|nr:DUF2019 domain-containing protein [Xanthobacteraceae bacterium]
MRRWTALQKESVEELVARFTAIALKQHEAVLYRQTTKYNRLYDQVVAVKDELKSRNDDERRALTSLYTYPNAMVRLQAARANLALGYTEARNVIQSIVDSDDQPLAFHAGMTLSNLDRGFYKPT